MKKFEVYSFDEKEIIDAFKKEGINVACIEGDKSSLYATWLEDEDEAKLHELYHQCLDVCNGYVAYVILKHILKIPYNKRVYMKSKAFCPDERQNLFGEFYLVLVE